MPKRKRPARKRQASPAKKMPNNKYRKRPSYDVLARAAHAVAAMRSEGHSLRRAAREQRIAAKTVLRHARSALRKGPSGKYQPRASDKLLRVLVIPTPDGLAEIATRDSRSATIAAEHANAVQLFLQTGDDSQLRKFEGKHILDTHGKRIPLLTDQDELERLGSAGVLSFESLYAKAS